MRDEYTTYICNRLIHFFQIKSLNLIPIFVSILLITTLFPMPTTLGASASAAKYPVLIEFTLPSIIQQLSNHSTESNMNTSLFSRFSNSVLQNLSVFQQNAISSIKSRLHIDVSPQSITQYRFVFNGIRIPHLSEYDMQKISQLSIVKHVEKDTRIIQTSSQLSSGLSFTNSFHDDQVVSNKYFNISSYSGAGVSIAFFDTGIDYTHTALSKAYKGGYDFVNDDADPFDDQGHGTHVTGITASQPNTDTNQPTSGIAPNASIYAYKVLDEEGAGYTSWFLSAFEHALDPNQDGNFSDRIDIISISAGNPEGSASDLLSNAALQAVQAGITVIAAAGNKGPSMDTISSPAVAKNVIAVGASVNNTMIAPYSSRGSIKQSYVKPDIIAPGHQITSTWPNNQYIALSGTSMATPYVTGIVACLFEQNPSLTPFEIQKILHSNAISIGYNVTTEGYGVISKSQTFPMQSSINVQMITSQKQKTNTLKINISHPTQQLPTNYSVHIYPINNKQSENSIHHTMQTNTNQTILEFFTIPLHFGYHTIELTISQNESLTRVKQIIYIPQSTNQSILFPQTITEKQEFTCQLSENILGESKALFIFYVPFRSLQFRIGSQATFTAPHLRFTTKENITATLLTIIPTGLMPQIEKNEIILKKHVSA